MAEPFSQMQLEELKKRFRPTSATVKTLPEIQTVDNYTSVFIDNTSTGKTEEWIAINGSWKKKGEF